MSLSTGSSPAAFPAQSGQTTLSPLPIAGMRDPPKLILRLLMPQQSRPRAAPPPSPPLPTLEAKT